MVPDSFDGYFTAAASAVGALIGLLFVAISMRPEAVRGENPSSRARALASSSFTGLVNGFFLSMAALIPGKNLGVTATILAALSLTATIRLHRRVGRSATKLAVSALTTVALMRAWSLLQGEGIESRTAG